MQIILTITWVVFVVAFLRCMALGFKQYGEDLPSNILTSLLASLLVSLFVFTVMYVPYRYIW